MHVMHAGNTQCHGLSRRHVCTGTGFTAATSALGSGSPHPDLHLYWTRFTLTSWAGRHSWWGLALSLSQTTRRTTNPARPRAARHGAWSASAQVHLLGRRRWLRALLVLGGAAGVCVGLGARVRGGCELGRSHAARDGAGTSARPTSCGNDSVIPCGERHAARDVGHTRVRREYCCARWLRVVSAASARLSRMLPSRGCARGSPVPLQPRPVRLPSTAEYRTLGPSVCLGVLSVCLLACLLARSLARSLAVHRHGRRLCSAR